MECLCVSHWKELMIKGSTATQKLVHVQQRQTKVLCGVKEKGLWCSQKGCSLWNIAPYNLCALLHPFLSNGKQIIHGAWQAELTVGFLLPRGKPSLAKEHKEPNTHHVIPASCWRQKPRSHGTFADGFILFLKEQQTMYQNSSSFTKLPHYSEATWDSWAFWHKQYESLQCFLAFVGMLMLMLMLQIIPC